jgi:uncharacterized protein (TIGR02391 family)
MEIRENEVFHARIINSCLSLFNDGHYPHAALESMKQVELALREKGLVPKNLFGNRLVEWVLGNGANIRLTVPLGDDLQEKALVLFKGAFGYYRNYAAHDGAKIDKTICFRVMVLASELLDLVAASSRSFEGIGGINGIIKAGIFKDAQEFKDFLEFHVEQQILECDYSEYEFDFQVKGFREIQQEAMFDFNFLRYKEMQTIVDEEAGVFDSTLLGIFELTSEGEKVLEELEKMVSSSNGGG